MRVQRTLLIYDNLHFIVAATFACSVIIVFMLRDHYAPTFLIPWFVGFLILSTARYSHLLYYRKKTLDASNINRRTVELCFFSLSSGIFWGVFGYQGIQSDDLLLSLIILMLFTGLVANATATVSHNMPVYLVFILPILLPAAYKFYTFKESFFNGIAVLILLYLVVSVASTRGIRKAIFDSINLRFQNLDLIDDLTIQNERTEAARLEVEKVSAAKSSFFAAASHDLRQPLHSLGFFTATLATHLKEEEQREILTKIDSSVGALEELFNAILDISSLDAGTMPVSKSHFVMCNKMVGFEAEIKSLCEEAGLECHCDIGDFVVHTDPLLLARAIRNLIANAIRYTKTGRIDIKMVEADGRALFTVSDTGIGIPEADQARILEEFVQLHNPERDRSKGLGLGLSIVQRISDLLDYDFDFESTAGIGSTFSLSIELGDLSQLEQEVTKQEPLDGSIDSMFVLLIDDEEQVRLAMEGMLMAWDCTVMLASSGAEAVQQLKEFEQNPDVIISDFRLREDETGGEAIKRVREYCGSDVPAIIITGDIAPDRLLELSKLGYPTLRLVFKVVS